MSNPVNFVNTYTAAITALVNQLNTLQALNAQLTDDPTLVTRYFATASFGQAPNLVPRTDIVAADITNAQAAIVQMLFTFNSGSPTNGSQLYKVTP
jgi:hypothetical protein